MNNTPSFNYVITSLIIDYLIDPAHIYVMKTENSTCDTILISILNVYDDSMLTDIYMKFNEFTSNNNVYNVNFIINLWERPTFSKGLSLNDFGIRFPSYYLDGELLIYHMVRSELKKNIQCKRMNLPVINMSPIVKNKRGQNIIFISFTDYDLNASFTISREIITKLNNCLLSRNTIIKVLEDYGDNYYKRAKLFSNIE